MNRLRATTVDSALDNTFDLVIALQDAYQLGSNPVGRLTISVGRTGLIEAEVATW
jgi:hypothetical protein